MPMQADLKQVFKQALTTVNVCVIMLGDQKTKRSKQDGT